MAAAKKCDNCGALYSYNRNVKCNAIMYGKVDSHMTWHSNNYIELCPGCLNVVISALEKSKNIATELRKENEQ